MDEKTDYHQSVPRIGFAAPTVHKKKEKSRWPFHPTVLAKFLGDLRPATTLTSSNTHPLAGHYRSMGAFIEGTFSKLSRVLPKGAQFPTEHLTAEPIVELHSPETRTNGVLFDNRYCWIPYFHDGVIVRVRAYLDSAMVARLFGENPIA